MRMLEAKRIVDVLAASPVPVTFAALQLRVPMPIDIAEDILHDLVEAKIVVRGAARRFGLAVGREKIRDDDIRVAVGAD